MSVFIKISIKPKTVGVSPYEAREISINSDSVLAFKLYRHEEYSVTLKPEYENAIKMAAGVQLDHPIDSILANSNDIKILLKLGKE